jgi:hypothetical protein
MLLQPLPIHATAPGGLPLPVRCGLDRHFGPFEEIPEMAGWLGTDWFTCRACRSPLTRATADVRLIAA